MSRHGDSLSTLSTTELALVTGGVDIAALGGQIGGLIQNILGIVRGGGAGGAAAAGAGAPQQQRPGRCPNGACGGG